MKQFISGVLMLIGFASFAQEFEIDASTYPYYDIIEWKGMGAILMSKDPNGNTKQVNLTLVADQTTSVWDQKFNPKSEEFYFISSENARYVYFLDNLEPDNGKIYFSQLNSAGNVKSTNVFIGTAIKKLGNYDHNDLELINIVVTDKALVHHFRYVDKKEKSIVEIATFITHHNFKCYASIIGKVPEANLKKDEDIGQWDYIGFHGDRILFAARDKSDKQIGWTVKEFSSKGEAGPSLFINAPKGLIPVENIGFGTTGKYYLDGSTTIDKGLLAFINNKFYMVGGQKKDAGAELTLYQLESNEWKELNSMNLNYFIEKKTLKLGIYPMNEGMGYHLDHNGYDKASMITFDPKVEVAHNTFTERTIYNPSSVFNRKERKEFCVELPDRVLTFDTDQLGKEGAVSFELEKK